MKALIATVGGTLSGDDLQVWLDDWSGFLSLLAVKFRTARPVLEGPDGDWVDDWREQQRKAGLD